MGVTARPMSVGVAAGSVGRLGALIGGRGRRVQSGAVSARRVVRAWRRSFREKVSAFHLFLIEATGNDVLIEAYRKLLVREYMGQVLTPSVNLVGDTTKEHIDIVDAFERGDFEALRRVIAEHTDQAQGDDAGRDQKPGSAG